MKNEGGRASFEILREGIWDERIIRDKIMYRILFVCTGNTCRSPMAEAIGKHLIAKGKGIGVEDLENAGVKVSSAGVYAGDGQMATPEAVVALKSLGIEMGDHRSSGLTREMIAGADEIFCMTGSHGAAVLDAFPEAGEKMRMVSG